MLFIQEESSEQGINSGRNSVSSQTDHKCLGIKIIIDKEGKVSHVLGVPSI